MRIVIVALVIALSLAGCDTQGSTPEHPIYYRCAQ